MSRTFPLLRGSNLNLRIWLPSSTYATNRPNTTVAAEIRLWDLTTCWRSYRMGIFRTLSNSRQRCSSSRDRSWSFTNIWWFVVSHLILRRPNCRYICFVSSWEILRLLWRWSNNWCMCEFGSLRVYAIKQMRLVCAWSSEIWWLKYIRTGIVWIIWVSSYTSIHSLWFILIFVLISCCWRFL